MRQFYEVYRNDEQLSPLARELPWTHNMIILSKCTRKEEREFYLRQVQSDVWDNPVNPKKSDRSRAHSGLFTWSPAL